MPRHISFSGTGVAVFILALLPLQGEAPAASMPYARYVTGLVASHMGQIPEPCTLSTEDAYTLDAPPAVIGEALIGSAFPALGDPGHLHIWYQMIENSESPDDRFVVRVNDSPVHILGGGPGAIGPIPPPTAPDEWGTLVIDLGDVDDEVELVLEMFTRTDVPTPTLLLIGAIEISDQASLEAPTLQDSLGYFEFYTDLDALRDTAFMGVVNLGALNMAPLLPTPGMLDDDEDAPPQNYLGRLGGMGMPYMAVSLCATRQESGDFVEVIFETDILFDDDGNRSRIGVEAIMDCTEDEDDPDCDICDRFYYTIPMHLLNRAGRPRLRVDVDNNSRVIADDFTLSYVSRTLYDWYPPIAMALNLFPNGNFESGLFPYVIEPGAPVCLPLNRVIIPTPDACCGAAAAVFQKPVEPGDECADGAVFDQPVSHRDDENHSAFRSNSETGFVFERVRNIEDIRVVDWWGLWLEKDSEDEDNWIPCVVPAANQTLEVWVVQDPVLGETAPERISGFLLPSTTTVPYTAPGSDTETTLLRYTFVAEEAFALMDGWLSVQQPDVTEDTTCLFFWANSPFGDNVARRWSGVPGDSPGSPLGNMSLCLYGGIFTDPQILGCAISPAVISRGQRATFTFYGRNLLLLNAIYLIPEMPFPGLPGDMNIPEHRYPLMDRFGDAPFQDVTYSGRLGDQLSVSFTFFGPFNENLFGDLICTDGRADFAALIGNEIIPAGPQDCSLLIDTIAPVLTIDDNPTADAAVPGVSPSVAVVNRVPATEVTALAGDLEWVPGIEEYITPKNVRLYRMGDMHIYVNPGSRGDVPYDQAWNEGPDDNLRITLNATFLDPYPVDGEGFIYPVEIAGFPAFFEASGVNPFNYPEAMLGAARWSGDSRALLGTYSHGADFFAVNGQVLDAVWTVGSLLDELTGVPIYGPNEPWRARFKLEARDRAGNTLDTGAYNNINIHWLFRTRAAVETRIDATAQIPDIYWGLDRGFPDLPDARSYCTPRAKFYLYLDVGDDYVLIAESVDWLWHPEPLRGTTLMSDGQTLQQILDNYPGARLCLGIQGADEAGNVQFYDDTVAMCWDNSGRPVLDTALETRIRLELFHERYGTAGRYRNYGTATRVPLPRLIEACDTRVNAWVNMRALTPSSMPGEYHILWKLYREGVLVARGAEDVTHLEPDVEAHLLQHNVDAEDFLLFRGGGAVVTNVDHADIVGGLLNLNTQFLDPGVSPYMGEPPGRWPDGSDYECAFKVGFDDQRLGDEGDPPLLLNPNAPSARRREIRYTLTAQTAINSTPPMIDLSPATASFSIYVLEVDEQVRDEAPIREFER